MEVPIEIHALIIRLVEGQFFRKTAKTVNKSHVTIQYIFDTQIKINILSNETRPRKLYSNQRQAIRRTVTENFKTSVPKLVIIVNKKYRLNLVPQTVKNVLKKFGYDGCTRPKLFIRAVSKRLL